MKGLEKYALCGMPILSKNDLSKKRKLAKKKKNTEITNRSNRCQNRNKL